MKATSLKVLAASLAMALGAGAVTVDVAVSKPGHEVPDSLWGIFLEDIAFSVDGCLYPELVWNRGFEFRPAPSDGFSLLDVTTDAVCGNPTYYAEKMFTHNRPERVVPVSYPKLTTRQPAGWDREKSPFNPKAEAIDVVAFHAGAGLAGDELVVKLVNAAPEARPVTLNLDVSVPAGKVAREVLSGAPGAKNTPEEPLRVVPKKDELPFSGGKTLNLDLAPYSFTVLCLRR